ncbi:HD domain-containing protein [Verrucomicrobiaceae bacterium 227]
MTEEEKWSEIFRQWLLKQEESDPAHDLPHIERVVANSRILCTAEGAQWDIVHPAAWLHDCVFVAKDSLDRARASTLSADHAIHLLEKAHYPSQHLAAIHHAIAAHSFSANIETQTLEAKILQDADRLDALGAFGLSRCLMLGGHMNSELMSPEDPFCESREPDDAKFVIDHFYHKLLKLEGTMKTKAGRELAAERADVLRDFLAQLRRELPS